MTENLIVTFKDARDYLRVDCDDSSIGQMICVAEARLKKLLGQTIEDIGEIPISLKQAVLLDVSQQYFNRLNPELPDDYYQLIMPYRKWSFGG